jgi:hypothetical protein
VTMIFTILLDVGVYLKIEEWLPVIVDLIYYSLQTGRGRRTLGEAYSNLVPVDLDSRDYFLKSKIKRIFWVVMTVLVPFTLKKGIKSDLIKRILDIFDPLNSIFFYYSGKYPSIVNRLLSIRYVRPLIFISSILFCLDILSEETSDVR